MRISGHLSPLVQHDPVPAPVLFDLLVEHHPRPGRREALALDGQHRGHVAHRMVRMVKSMP